MYKRHANRVADLIREKHPDVPVLINTSKPRSKSFEITYKSGERDEVIWTGVKLGPPRKLKFVENGKLEELLAACNM